MANSAAETALTTVPVLNGTLLSPKVAEYVNRYRGFAKQTAEAIINLAETLVEAEEKLLSDDFALFLDEVGLENDGATHKKLRQIGKQVSRFKDKTEKLPNAWTTLYKLAQLPLDKFEQVVPHLTPFITAKQIDAIGTTKQPAVRHQRETDELVVSLEGLDPQSKAAIYWAINELKKKFAFTLKASEELEEEVMGAVKQDNHAAVVTGNQTSVVEVESVA